MLLQARRGEKKKVARIADLTGGWMGIVLLASCGGIIPETPNRMTLQWQRANCPAADLAPLTRPDGRLAEVTIIALEGERLYVPTEWLRRGAHPIDPRGPPRETVVAGTGGMGGLSPGLDPHFPGDDRQPFCLGTVHRAGSSQSRRQQRRDPDFLLGLRFRQTTTDSPDGRVIDYRETLHAHQVLQFVWSAAGEPDRWWAGPPLPGGPGVHAGDGWLGVQLGAGLATAATREIRIDRSLDSDAFNSVFMGVQVHGGWRFSFRVSPHVVAIYTLSHRVDIVRWRAYRAQVREIHAWLKTPPAGRDEDRRFSF
jgi:hypothetical protein